MELLSWEERAAVRGSSCRASLPQLVAFNAPSLSQEPAMARAADALTVA